MKDTILVDVDGVLLDWNTAFDEWMNRLGYRFNASARVDYYFHAHYDITEDKCRQLIEEFNHSNFVRKLSPLRDSVDVVKQMSAEGWVFKCITSIGSSPIIQALREQNLIEVFGRGVFSDVVCLPTCSPKDHELKKYEGSNLWWIEDNVTNARTGASLGLNVLLMDHDYNQEATDLKRVNDWAEIYRIVNS